MTTEVHYYRYYCQTESNFVYKWDTSSPLTCPNDHNHVIDSNSITIIDTVSTSQVEVIDAVKTQFQESVSVNKKVLLSLQSSLGKTTLRDNYITFGSANILNNNNCEYHMLVTGSNDKASITSLERVRCHGHLTNEMCFGVRIPQTLSSNQYIRFGMYDNSDSNGVFFKYDKSGVGIGFLSTGVNGFSECNITQSNLNIDIMNGNGVSGIILEPSNGYVYGLRISGNGPRVIDYGVYCKSVYGDQRFFTMHRLFTNNFNNKPFFKNNLPLTIEIANNGTSGSNSIFLSDRSAVVYGDIGSDVQEVKRTNSLYVPSVTISTSNDFVPIASLRKKSDSIGVNTYLEEIDIICSTPQVITVTSGSTLIGSSWQSLPLQVITETVLECDTSASVVSNDGIMIWQGLASNGSTILKIPKCPMNGTLPMVVSAKNVSTSGTITLVARVTEAW